MTGANLVSFLLIALFKWLELPFMEDQVVMFSADLVQFVNSGLIIFGQLRRNDLSYGLLRNGKV